MTQLLTVLLIILVVVLLLLVAFVLYQLSTLKKDDSQKVLLTWLSEMKGSLERNTDVLDSKLDKQQQSMSEELRSYRSSIENQTKHISDRLETAAKLVSDVQNNLGIITDFGKDIKDLSNVMRSPKLRGGLGEKMLEDILATYLPRDLFAKQYKFAEGTICDFVVFIQDGIIPIDSKFPSDNFKRMVESPDETKETFRKEFVKDVKKKVDEIATRYIKPGERTMSQAVMFIPSESIYYEVILNSPEIEDYAKDKSVFLTSPNTFVYMLKVLSLAYKSYEIQKNTGAVIQLLMGLKVDAGKFSDEMGVLEKHINNAYKTFESTKSSFGRLFSKIENVEALGDGDIPKLT